MAAPFFADAVFADAVFADTVFLEADPARELLYNAIQETRLTQ